MREWGGGEGELTRSGFDADRDYHGLLKQGQLYPCTFYFVKS